MQYTFLNTQTDAQVTSLRSVQSRQNSTLVRHVSGQEAWHGLVTTLGGSSIASQSRINRGFLDQIWKTMSAKSPTPHSFLRSRYGGRAQPTPQPPELGIWRSGPGTIHIHRSLRSAVRVQAWQHPELAEMTQGGRQAGEGEEGEGPAPLLKSRDPLLAGGEKNLQSPAHKTAARTHTKSNYITYMIFSHIHSR